MAPKILDSFELSSEVSVFLKISDRALEIFDWQSESFSVPFPSVKDFDELRYVSGWPEVFSYNHRSFSSGPRIWGNSHCDSLLVFWCPNQFWVNFLLSEGDSSF